MPGKTYLVLQGMMQPKPNHNTVLMCMALKDKRSSYPTQTLTTTLTQM